MSKVSKLLAVYATRCPDENPLMTICTLEEYITQLEMAIHNHSLTTLDDVWSIAEHIYEQSENILNVIKATHTVYAMLESWDAKAEAKAKVKLIPPAENKLDWLGGE